MGDGTHRPKVSPDGAGDVPLLCMREYRLMAKAGHCRACPIEKASLCVRGREQSPSKRVSQKACKNGNSANGKT